MPIFPCNVCQTSLSADDSQVGLLVRCPTCLATLRVPASQPEMVGVATASEGGVIRSPTMRSGASSGLGRRFGFNCGYCSSRLEGIESQSGQEGQCPTCGNTIYIPILDRYGRLIDPRSGEIIKPDPHPVHAYAAAGDRAPRIIRTQDGSSMIQCSRCPALSPITANNCKSCGMPFTMEGTTLEAGGASNGFCVASLVLGIIGLPAFCAIIFPVLAIVFGIIGYMQVSQSGVETAGKGMAIAGIVCGAIGLLLAAMYYLG